jgi:hypothetical protein
MKVGNRFLSGDWKEGEFITVSQRINKLPEIRGSDEGGGAQETFGGPEMMTRRSVVDFFKRLLPTQAKIAAAQQEYADALEIEVQEFQHGGIIPPPENGQDTPILHYGDAIVSAGKELGQAPFTHTTTFVATDEAQRVVTGIILAPDEPDAQDHIVNTGDIEAAAHDFMSRLQLDAHHDRLVQSDEVRVVESWIQREPVTFSLEMDGETRITEVKPGSWCMSVKVLDNELWDEVLNGEITGFSPVGVAVSKAEK